MKDSIPDLKFERIEDGLGEGLILLTQDDNGDPGRVAIHPVHLRYMAESAQATPMTTPAQASLL